MKENILKEDNKMGFFAVDCPADTFLDKMRNYLKIQEEYKKLGKEIPDKYKMPSKVYLSEECINFFLNEADGNIIGAENDGKRN